MLKQKAAPATQLRCHTAMHTSKYTKCFYVQRNVYCRESMFDVWTLVSVKYLVIRNAQWKLNNFGVTFLQFCLYNLWFFYNFPLYLSSVFRNLIDPARFNSFKSNKFCHLRHEIVRSFHLNWSLVDINTGYSDLQKFHLIYLFRYFYIIPASQSTPSSIRSTLSLHQT